jgi:hypothetical protein
MLEALAAGPVLKFSEEGSHNTWADDLGFAVSQATSCVRGEHAHSKGSLTALLASLGLASEALWDFCRTGICHAVLHGCITHHGSDHHCFVLLCRLAYYGLQTNMGESLMMCCSQVMRHEGPVGPEDCCRRNGSCSGG